MLQTAKKLRRLAAKRPHGEIVTEAMRRKMAKEKDAQLSAVIREAVAQYLQGR